MNSKSQNFSLITDNFDTTYMEREDLGDSWWNIKPQYRKGAVLVNYPNSSFLKYRIYRYSDGKLNGTLTESRVNGTFYYQIFKNDSLIHFSYIDSLGNVLSIMNKLSDSNLLYVIDWYPDGSIKSSYYLNNFMKDSEAKSYYNNGALKSVGFWKNGKPHGIFKDYLPNGILLKVEKWKFGKIKKCIDYKIASSP